MPVPVLFAAQAAICFSAHRRRCLFRLGGAGHFPHETTSQSRRCISYARKLIRSRSVNRSPRPDNNQSMRVPLAKAIARRLDAFGLLLPLYQPWTLD